MDHALRTISYIADIEDIVVIMARRRMLTSPGDDALRKKKQTKILCHVFESDEVGKVKCCNVGKINMEILLSVLPAFPGKKLSKLKNIYFKNSVDLLLLCELFASVCN